MANDRILVQRLGMLAGSHAFASLGEGAVRLDDLRGLLALPERPKSSKAVDGPPNAVEFNALVEDVHAIHAALRVVVTALRAAQGR